MQIIRVEECSSTNDVAMRLAQQGASSFTTVVAQYQTSGRGRAGHTWTAPAGVSLCFSVVLRLGWKPELMPLSTFACGIALAHAVGDCVGLSTGLKWPNDLLVNGRKVAGVLCECESFAEEMVVVAGVGVNVNTATKDLPQRPIFPASSLLAELGSDTPLDKDAILNAFLEQLSQIIAAPDLSDEWLIGEFNRLDALRGCEIRVVLPTGDEVRGIDLGADSMGRLVVGTSSGEVAVMAGSIVPV